MSALVWIIVAISVLVILAVIGYLIYRSRQPARPPIAPAISPPSITPIFSPPATPTCTNRFSTIPGLSIDGLDMTTPDVMSKQECENKCSSNNCDWLNYDSTLKKCFLKKGGNNQETITAFRIVDNPSGLSCPNYYIVPNTNIPLYDIGMTPNITQSACENLCQQNNCDWFNYNTNKSQCFLKKGDRSNPAQQTSFKIK